MWRDDFCIASQISESIFFLSYLCLRWARDYVPVGPLSHLKYVYTNNAGKENSLNCLDVSHFHPPCIHSKLFRYLAVFHKWQREHSKHFSFSIPGLFSSELISRELNWKTFLSPTRRFSIPHDDVGFAFFVIGFFRRWKNVLRMK